MIKRSKFYDIALTELLAALRALSDCEQNSEGYDGDLTPAVTEVLVRARRLFWIEGIEAAENAEGEKEDDKKSAEGKEPKKKVQVGG